MEVTQVANVNESLVQVLDCHAGRCEWAISLGDVMSAVWPR